MNPPTNDIPLKSHPELIEVSDVAAILKVSRSQVYALIESQKLRCYRITTGKQGGIRVSIEQLRAYLQSVEEGGQSLPPGLKHITLSE